jgi:hypothetical protein
MWLRHTEDDDYRTVTGDSRKTLAEMRREHVWVKLPGTTPLPFPAIPNGTASEARLRDRSIFSEVKLQAEMMRCV